jgi:hypothetical protein
VTGRASEDSSYLKPLGYRDRLASERAKTVHALDRSATVTGLTRFKPILISSNDGAFTLSINGFLESADRPVF